MIRVTTIALLLCLSSGPAYSEEPVSTADPRLAELVERLDLSAAQREQFEPIMHTSIEQRRAILARYGINLDDPGPSSQRPSFRQARAMRSEMQGVQKELMGNLEGVLTEAQLKTLAQIQEEQRAAMRQRMMGG